MNHPEYAAELFLKGYNCAQAVLIAFGDLTGLDEKTSARFVSGFGGGFGRLREVCGAVSGMAAVAGILYGYDSPTDDEAKMKHYELVQQLAGKFRESAGSIICREILENPPSDPAPSPRTAQYYAERPCARLVHLAASILDAYIAEHPVNNP
jgi:C_GCAxxG_C_C family probable redox protein